MEKTARELKPKTLIVAGGVACNGTLRSESEIAAKRLEIPIYFPSKHLSTDNAAMIAAAGEVKLLAGERAVPEMTADITMRLQNVDVPSPAELRKVRYRL
jgi:N6-L-threonylcarbamoyladenine synthase